MKNQDTTKSRIPRGLLIIFYIFFVFLFCHHFIFRQIILDWGSTEELRQMSLPGDKFVKGNAHTRAVLIDAPADSVWLLMLQLGQERGGFYSYAWLENLFLADMHNILRYDPQLQKPRADGDTIWLASKNRYRNIGYQVIADAEPARSFVMVSGSDYARILDGKNATGSWALYLMPVNETQTWLIARSSGGYTNSWERFLRYVFYEVPHFIMERKMLLTIKQLSETGNT